MYRIRVQNIWWRYIAAKRKTVEVRIFKDAHAHIVPGDKIEITNKKMIIIGISIKYFLLFMILPLI